MNLGFGFEVLEDIKTLCAGMINHPVMVRVRILKAYFAATFISVKESSLTLLARMLNVSVWSG